MTDTPNSTPTKKTRRWLRTLIAALVLTPLLALAWLITSQTGLHWAFQYAKPYVPGELKLASLDGSLIGPITLHGVEYTQDGARITLDQLILDWSPATLLAAQVKVNRIHATALEITLPASGATRLNDQPFTLPDIQLPWRVVLKDVVVDGASLHQNGKDVSLQQLRLDATTFLNQLNIKKLSIHSEQFDLTINGNLELARAYAHDLHLQWQVRLPSSTIPTTSIKGAGQLRGDLSTTRLQQTLSGPVQLSLDAQISEPLKHPRWQATVNAHTNDISILDAALPAASGNIQLSAAGDLNTASLSGTAKGHYPEIGPFTSDFSLQRLTDNSVWIERLMLHAPETDTQLQLRGQWLPGDNGGAVDVAAQWQNLHWPPKRGNWFNSAIGSGWIVGNLQHYQAGLATDRPWPQAPASDWYASADGNLDGLNFHSLRVHTPKGEALATGPLHWTPRLSWQAKLIATDIDPATLFPQIPQTAQWPGQLQTSIISKGQMENGQLNTSAEITRLSGTLRGYPISLRSRLAWRDSGVDIDHFDFHSGSAQVTARGRIGNNLKLDWSIAAPDMAELYPQAHGQLNARGQLGGTQAIPLIKAELSGKTLQIPGYAIGNIDATLAADVFRWQQLGIKLAAQSITIPGYMLQSLNITANNQHLQAKAVADKESLQLALQGELSTSGWQGHIERADIQSHRFSDWQLIKPAALTLSQTKFSVSDLCWHNVEDAQICMTLLRDPPQGEQQETQQDTALQSRLDIKRLPLALFSAWLAPELQISGVANATASLQFYATDHLLGQASITLPPGQLTYPLLQGEKQQWDYRQGKLEINVDEEGINASADLALHDGDQLRGQLNLPGAQPLALNADQQALNASAQLLLRNPGFIEAVVTNVQGLHGELTVNLAANGTLAQPVLSGQAQLRNGGLRIPRLGLDIAQLTLDAHTDDQHRLQFNAAAHSGEGDLTLDGYTTLDPAAGWPTELKLKGTQFEVSRIPEARVVVSPDLLIQLQQRRINIEGEVHIPYAKLQPKDLTTATRVSSDVIILGEQQKPEEAWAITTRVRVTLGEQVSFYGFGFEGRIGGNLLIRDEPGQLTTASGELSIIEGHYRAYGQRLDVENGRLLYTGGPLTNPGLDLTAVRHVNEVTAGLRVRGSLTQPQIELFALPAMGQTDTLAYLLLGRPIENATGEEGAMMAKAALALGLSGGNRLARSLTDQFGLDEMRVESSDKGDQASLVMGRYLSPKLYVSYGVGLIEAFNTFTVRYQISSKWQLKAESGEYHGADILYTIER